VVVVVITGVRKREGRERNGIEERERKPNETSEGGN
jgi:hypothetical protein